MYIILIALVCVFGVLIFMVATEGTTIGNVRRHLTAEHSYAHFSAVDANNYIVTPSLLLTHPHRFKLTEGQSLWIPRGWWHWVRTQGPSVAVNFWMPRQVGSSLVPYILKEFSQPPSLLREVDAVATETEIWRSDLDIIVKNFQVASDNNYIITLGGYSKKGSFEPLNSRLLNVAKRHAKIPSGASVNVWISSGNHDTGLHYDDNDGILTVLRGTKYITLYPPSDSLYLRPLSIIPSWATQRPASVQYNLYKFGRYLSNTSLPSARMLYESIHNKAVLKEITKMKYETSEPLVWGCKLQDGELRWEIYAYHYDMYDISQNNDILRKFRSREENPGALIHSIDLFDRENPVGPDVHYYYKDSDGAELPVHGYGTTGRTEPESQYIIDTQSNVIKTFYDHAESIGFSKEEITNCRVLLHQYECKHIALWNKYKKQLYIQYYGIPIASFLQFLKKYEYPSSLIDHVSGGGYEEIEHEITIVYDLQTLLPVRSGFYGIV